MSAFNPRQPSSILTWTETEITALPPQEDDGFEYKSSLTTDADLATKLGRAASGFWNSGGGAFVAGVDGKGQPDGGISDLVGRQSRRDWADQVIAKVAPSASYSVVSISSSNGSLNIQPNKHVLAIGFGESYAGPHMANAGRYYIRAGAHTDDSIALYS
jgi:hypothetical protein